MIPLPFSSRTDAAIQLAAELDSYKGAKDTVVLCLVRGGVVTGATLGKELNLPYFPYIVRKLGHPNHREFALGAIAEGGATYLDEKSMQTYSVPWEEVEKVIDEEMQELVRRQEVYLTEARPNLEGKTIILTDDGAATGASLFAAIEDLRNLKVKKIIVALPVCPPSAAVSLKEKADEVRVLIMPEDFYAVGQFYKEFEQVEDEEVIELLRRER